MALVPLSPSPRREPGTSAASVDTHTDMHVPLDYCFMNITDIMELPGEEPRYPADKSHDKCDDDKFQSKCLRLPHNVLQDLKSLPATLPKLLSDPDSLSWLDLSHNELITIDPVLCDLPSLKILYLHGNHINNIQEVDKLGGISTLTKLTLHGNQIETTKNYRYYVLCHVPHLRNLDFSAITKGDRATAATWQKTTPQKKKKVQEED